MKFLDQLKQKVKLLKRETSVIYAALKDPRTPIIAKLMAAATIAYLLSPIDLIPDFIPVLGLLDDLILVPLMITLTLKLIPSDIIADIREKSILEEKPAKQWYFAIPVILFYLGLIYFAARKFTGIFVTK